MPEFVNRTWMQIRAQFEGLSPSARWLMGTLLVLGVLVVSIIVNLVAAGSESIAINQFAGSRTEEAFARLQARGIQVSREGATIRVPKSQENEAILALVESNLLSENASAAFDALLGNTSPWATNEQTQRAYELAKQKYLASVLRGMPGVRNADVVIDFPRNRGFAATYTKPSASVTIATERRGANAKQLVETAAALVSGAVAEMDPANVRVIVDGRMHRVGDDNDVLPTQTLELVHSLEQYHERKIGELLDYIPGVRIAVLVQVDDVARRQEEAFRYEQSESLRSEETEEINRRDIRRAGEPGARPNTGLDIAGGGGAGMEETISRSRADYGDKPLLMRSQTVHSGNQVRRINVTVNVPRSYFVQYHRRMNPVEQEEPDAAALQPTVDRLLAEIQRQVEPLIQTEADGQVVATMIPDEQFMAGGLPPVEQGGVGPMLVAYGKSPYAVPGVLAAVAIGMMLWMVRRATQQEQLPTVEELAGVPPRLPSDEELVGEADEHEAAMTGVELDEDEIRSRKMAEQISELIKSNPDEAGSLLGRWVRRDD